MADLIPVLNEDEIKKMVADVAQKISDDYKNSELVQKSLFRLKLILSVFPAMVQILFHLEK